jgi:hypothetical protein
MDSSLLNDIGQLISQPIAIIYSQQFLMITLTNLNINPYDAECGNMYPLIES